MPVVKINVKTSRNISCGPVELNLSIGDSEITIGMYRVYLVLVEKGLMHVFFFNLAIPRDSITQHTITPTAKLAGPQDPNRARYRDVRFSVWSTKPHRITPPAA